MGRIDDGRVLKNSINISRTQLLQIYIKCFQKTSQNLKKILLEKNRKKYLIQKDKENHIGEKEIFLIVIIGE